MEKDRIHDYIVPGKRAHLVGIGGVSMSPLAEVLHDEGLIITDDLGMGAIIKNYSFGGAAVKAVQAGADLVLVCHDYGHAEEAYMGIYEAVKAGEISEKRLDESVRRIIKAKLRHGLRPSM